MGATPAVTPANSNRVVWQPVSAHGCSSPSPHGCSSPAPPGRPGFCSPPMPCPLLQQKPLQAEQGRISPPRAPRLLRQTSPQSDRQASPNRSRPALVCNFQQPQHHVERGRSSPGRVRTQVVRQASNQASQLRPMSSGMSPGRSRAESTQLQQTSHVPPPRQGMQRCGSLPGGALKSYGPTPTMATCGPKVRRSAHAGQMLNAGPVGKPVLTPGPVAVLPTMTQATPQRRLSNVIREVSPKRHREESPKRMSAESSDVHPLVTTL